VIGPGENRAAVPADGTGVTLVMGATGTTGSRVATRLAGAGRDVLKASRSGADGFVRFDWLDDSTWPPLLGSFERLYLVAPIAVADPRPVVEPFLVAAVAAGLRRTVLLSSSAVDPAPSGLGALHALVTEVSPEWGVLRPSWFMQNFTGDLPPAHGIRQGSVVTATGGGRIGFVDASDIAAVASELLVREEPVRDEFVLTGPEPLSFADVCAIASDALGTSVGVSDMTPDEFADYLTGTGVPSDFAQVLASLDEAISRGVEDRVTNTVEEVTGRRPTDMRTFLTGALRAS
jgi:uncharacterized protein YbjT (DUF2867 family)